MGIFHVDVLSALGNHYMHWPRLRCENKAIIFWEQSSPTSSNSAKRKLGSRLNPQPAVEKTNILRSGMAPGDVSCCLLYRLLHRAGQLKMQVNCAKQLRGHSPASLINYRTRGPASPNKQTNVGEFTSTQRYNEFSGSRIGSTPELSHTNGQMLCCFFGKSCA